MITEATPTTVAHDLRAAANRLRREARTRDDITTQHRDRKRDGVTALREAADRFAALDRLDEYSCKAAALLVHAAEMGGILVRPMWPRTWPMPDELVHITEAGQVPYWQLMSARTRARLHSEGITR